MNLKFTFNQAASHSHDDEPVAAPAGRALPFSVTPASNSSELRVEVRAKASADAAAAPAFEATVLSGDDVSYGHGVAPIRGTAPDAESLAARSAISRALADTGEHLLSAITAVQLEVPNAVIVAAGLGLTTDAAGTWRTTLTLQQRTGLPEGTEVRVPSARPAGPSLRPGL